MKKYPFSAAKHGHDIELYYNRLRNTMYDMESGEIPMDWERYERIEKMAFGPVEELIEIMGGYPVVYLTGKQIALAKKIVIWASETRAATCVRNGRLDLVQYC